MFKSNEEDDEGISESDVDPPQLKPHQPLVMTPLCHVTTSSASDDSLVI